MALSQYDVGHPSQPPVHIEACDLGVGTRVPVVFLWGEFDLETVPLIERFLRQRFGPFFYRRTIMLDLAGVTLVDSSFISFVVALTRQLRAERQELILTRPGRQVSRILALVGVPNLVPVYGSLDDAVKAVSGGTVPCLPPPFPAPEAARA